MRHTYEYLLENGEVLKIILTDSHGVSMADTWAMHAFTLDKECVGIIEEILFDGEDEETSLRISGVLVEIPHREKGVCSAMLDVLAQWDRSHVLDQRIEVRESNEIAIAAFEKNGFYVLSSADGNNLIMQRDSNEKPLRPDAIREGTA